MERAELGRRLRRGAGEMPPETSSRGATVPAPHRVISETKPERFMAALADAVGGTGDVFLADPGWGETEWDQFHSLLATGATLTTAPFVQNDQGAGAPVPSGNETGWLMIPTGGTSGILRFARHDGATLAAAVTGFTKHYGLRQVNAVGVLPLHHVSGLMAWMRCALTGGEYLQADWKEIEAGRRPALRSAAEGWVLSLVPTQLERLLRDRAAIDWLRGFRLIVLGGGPAWPDLLNRAAAERLPLSLSYGMTETAAMVTALLPADFQAGVRSSGWALPHAVVKTSAEGVVVIAGKSLFRGYYPGWREPGEFATEDLGSLDPFGRLTVSGRRDGVIITGGEKVNPSEVEAVLRATGEFADVTVVGLPHAEWGAEVVALYPANPAPDLAKVAVALAGQLARHKLPRRFVAVPDWPRNAQGKLNRTDLLRQAGLLPNNPAQ